MYNMRNNYSSFEPPNSSISSQVPPDNSKVGLYDMSEAVAHVAVFTPLWAVMATSSSLLIYAMYKYKKFHSSGYLLLSALLAGETTYITCFTMGKILALAVRSGTTEMNHGVAALLGTSLEVVNMVNLTLMTLIAIQRVCCIYAPHQFHLAFSTRNMKFASAAIVIFYMLVHMVNHIRGCYFYWNTEMLDSWVREKDALQPYFVTISVLIFVFLSINAVSYALIMYKFVWKHVDMRRVSRSRSRVTHYSATAAATDTKQRQDVELAHILDAPAIAVAPVSVVMRDPAAVIADNAQRIAVENNRAQYNREVKLTSQFFVISVIYLLGMTVFLIALKSIDMSTGLKTFLTIKNVVYIVNNCGDPVICIVLNRELRDATNTIVTKLFIKK